MALPTRHKIAAVFNIPKRGSTEVVDNQIKSDGYHIKEIEELLSIVALQNYLGVTETDELLLWEWLLDKIEGRPLRQVNIDTTEKEIELPKVKWNPEKEQLVVTNKKRGRKPKAK